MSMNSIIITIFLPALAISGIVNFVACICYYLGKLSTIVPIINKITLASWCVSCLLLTFAAIAENSSGSSVFYFFIGVPTLIMLIISQFLPYPLYTAFMITLFWLFVIFIAFALLCSIGVISTHISHN